MKSFDSEKHIYRVPGFRLPGATDIIKTQGVVDDSYMSEAAKWRGKCVHRGLELMLKNELDWNSVDETIAGYLRSAQKFIEVTGFEVVGGEQPCFDDAFACMPDVWGILNGQRSVVEFKTGVVPKWTAIQTALQRRALKTEFGFDAVKRFGLRLMADGSLASLQPFEDTRDDRRAMSMVDAFWWRKENGYIRFRE